MKNRTKWAVDRTNSVISFKVKHLMITHVKGAFKRFDANIHADGKNFTNSEIELWIDPSSLTTNYAKRDNDLKSNQFLDVITNTQITFISNFIGTRDYNNNFELRGNLTMNGISKELLLNVLFRGIIVNAQGIEKAGFTITGVIRRSDWNLTWSPLLETGGILVSDEINISCEIQLAKAS